MRSTFSLLVVLILLLPGCATMRGSRVDTGGMTAYDGVSADYPGDAQSLAASAAEEMARRYPPARTTLALVKTDSTFGQDLESALREQGFPIAAPDASGVRVGYTLDVIRDETPSNCYLRVRTSDGTAFGTLRVLTGEPRRTAREGISSESAASASVSAPESHSLKEVPTAVATTPRPEPVMSSKIERKAAASRENAGIPVRVKSTAAKVAKRNRISVEEFCRLNDMVPDTVIPAGRRVLLHEPHEPAVALTPLPEPARVTKTTAYTPPSTTIQPAVAVRPVETTHAPGKAPDPIPAVPSPVSRLLAEKSDPVKQAGNPPSAVQTSPAAPATVTSTQPAPLSGPASMAAPASSGPTPTLSPAATAQASGPIPSASPAQTPASSPPPPPAPPAPSWDVAPGSLHSQLEHWAMRAHYQLIWKAQHDFELEARAGFEGDFETAIKQLFAGLHRSGHALRVTLYRGNNVLEVAED